MALKVRPDHSYYSQPQLVKMTVKTQHKNGTQKVTVVLSTREALTCILSLSLSLVSRFRSEVFIVVVTMYSYRLVVILCRCGLLSKRPFNPVMTSTSRCRMTLPTNRPLVS